jgi:hypothetical protein
MKPIDGLLAILSMEEKIRPGGLWVEDMRRSEGVRLIQLKVPYDSFPCDSFFVINHIFRELYNFPVSFSDENKMPEI